MNIALIGYGRMGKEIEKIAMERGHRITGKITAENKNEISGALEQSDVAIEFSIPEAVVQNIKTCFAQNTPVVVGTTGWNEHLETLSEECHKQGQSLFHASNFSVGVNLFFEVNKHLAGLMETFDNYDVEMEETHHIHKLDAPSGTAITLAEQILEKLSRKSKWKKETAENSETLVIKSKREGEVPGTHKVKYTSYIDDITIKHEAKNRKGFALGAVLAAEFVTGKKGVFTMQDLLKLR